MLLAGSPPPAKSLPLANATQPLRWDCWPRGPLEAEAEGRSICGAATSPSLKRWRICAASKLAMLVPTSEQALNCVNGAERGTAVNSIFALVLFCLLSLWNLCKEIATYKRGLPTSIVLSLAQVLMLTGFCFSSCCHQPLQLHCNLPIIIIPNSSSNHQPAAHQQQASSTKLICYSKMGSAGSKTIAGRSYQAAQSSARSTAAAAAEQPLTGSVAVDAARGKGACCCSPFPPLPRLSPQ